MSKENTVLIPDPVYPVYVDTNVMAGRKTVSVFRSAIIVCTEGIKLKKRKKILISRKILRSNYEEDTKLF